MGTNTKIVLAVLALICILAISTKAWHIFALVPMMAISAIAIKEEIRYDKD